jgi:aminocarboxymuconate-semialdehyde decarboxylase
VKIDAFNHIVTPRYNAKRRALAPAAMRLADVERAVPTLFDLDARLRVMDTAGEGYLQILSAASPPVEQMAGPSGARELSQIVNDEMAELVARMPDRFAGAAACLPMNDVEGALEELDRAVRRLGMCAVQLYTDVQGQPLDDPEFRPVFDRIAALGLPILLHPCRSADRPDYPSEPSSRFDTWRIFGWLYDTVSAMTRLVFSGLFDRHPDIVVVSHHLGGFAPYAAGRIQEGYDKLVKAARARGEALPLASHPAEYFRRFHADTITGGSVPALACGIEYFGVDRVLFATDMPFDTEGGRTYIDVALRAMEQIDLSRSDKHKILEGNARRVFRLGF